MTDTLNADMAEALIASDLRMGDLEVRLAESKAEILAAQRLRYRVFYQEMGAIPDQEIQAQARDFDPYDNYCDHLLVIDHRATRTDEAVVGTYRLIRRVAAARAGSFYSADEYDISKILSYPGEILELGRSCVDVAYRTRGSMQLLWRGIAAYAAHHAIEIMFGCASLAGTDPGALAAPLSYLYHRHLAPPAIRPVALPHRYVDMNMFNACDLDLKRAFIEVPPLIKGYLRAGGFIGDGAVIDQQFNTTDVAIIVKTDLMTDKYVRHYERKGSQLL
jgi:L-ornithine Nalpha-acyltransferase